MRPLSLLPLVFAGLFLPAPLLAQTVELTTLSGTVTDAETGAPLEGAHVFIAVSLNGAVTDANGRYRLDGVPVGAHRLYVSRLGYEPEPRDVLLRRGGMHVFDFALKPAVVELGEVVVEAKRDQKWRRQLEAFTRLFIGETPNAQETKIMNPEVLDFEGSVGHLKAHASEPLIIENHALGYRIQYFLKDFASTPTRVQYDGEPLFEEMTPTSLEEAARWTAKRDSAFYGSFRHFILAALAGQLEEQGFKLYQRPAPDGTTQGAAQGVGLSATRIPEQRYPAEVEALYTAGEVPTEKILDFDGFVEFIYLGETETEAFLEWQGRPGRPKYQSSFLWLERGPTVVDYKGDLHDPYGVTSAGFIAFERVADELPKEYRPR